MTNCIPSSSSGALLELNYRLLRGWLDHAKCNCQFVGRQYSLLCAACYVKTMCTMWAYVCIIIIIISMLLARHLWTSTVCGPDANGWMRYAIVGVMTIGLCRGIRLSRHGSCILLLKIHRTQRQLRSIASTREQQLSLAQKWKAAVTDWLKMSDTKLQDMN